MQWLARHLPAVPRIAVASNAEAARLAAAEPGAAAIAGENAARDLRARRPRAAHRGRAEQHDALLGARAAQRCRRSGDDETSLVMSAPNRPGAVHALLEPFAKHGVQHVAPRVAAGAHRPVGIPVLRRSRRAIATIRRWPPRWRSFAESARFSSCWDRILQQSIRNCMTADDRHRTLTPIRRRWRPTTCGASRRYMPGKPIEELARELGLDEARSSSSRRTRIRAGRARRCARPSPPRRRSCRRYPDGNGFALKDALAKRFGVDADADRARQRLERHSRARDAGVPASGRRRRLFAVMRSPCIRWPRRRAAPPASRSPARDLRARPRRDARGDRRRTRAWSSSPIRTIRPAPGRRRQMLEAFIASVPAGRARRARRGVQRIPRAAAAGRQRSWIAESSESARLAHLLESLRPRRRCASATASCNARVADMLNRVRQPFNVNALAQAAALAALDDADYVDESRALNRHGHARSSRTGFDAARPRVRAVARQFRAGARSATRRASTSGC